MAHTLIRFPRFLASAYICRIKWDFPVPPGPVTNTFLPSLYVWNTRAWAGVSSNVGGVGIGGIVGIGGADIGCSDSISEVISFLVFDGIE